MVSYVAVPFSFSALLPSALPPLLQLPIAVRSLGSVSLYDPLVRRLKGLGHLRAVGDDHVTVVLLLGAARPVPASHDDNRPVEHAELVMLQGGYGLDLDENPDRLEPGVKIVLTRRLFLVEANPDIGSSFLGGNQIVGELQIRDPVQRAVDGLAGLLKLDVDGTINLVIGGEQRLDLASPDCRDRQHKPERENECFH